MQKDGPFVDRSQRVPPGNRKDMERLAQYIIRHPFSVEKMRPNSSGDSIIYRSGMNPKIGRNFEVLSPCNFIARITQPIPNKSFQLVRYYGWCSNKMRGQRIKRAEPEAGLADAGARSWRSSSPRPARARRANHRALTRRPLPRLRPRTGVRAELRAPAAPSCTLEVCISSPPAHRNRHFVARARPPAPRAPLHEMADS